MAEDEITDEAEEHDEVQAEQKATPDGWSVRDVSGALSGARIGSAIIPVPIVGTLVGGVMGAAYYSDVRRRLFRAVRDGAVAFAETMAETPGAE